MTENFQRIIRDLDRLNCERSAPEDFIHNAAKIADSNTFTEEEQMNFYMYITCQNTTKFEYTAKKNVVCLGDMPIEELERINAELAIHNVDIRQNGNETLMLVKNMEKLVLLDKAGNKYGKPVASASSEIQKSSPGNFVEKSNGRIEKKLPQGVSGSSQEDEKKSEG
jgi:hypothetical protein